MSKAKANREIYINTEIKQIKRERKKIKYREQERNEVKSKRSTIHILNQYNKVVLLIVYSAIVGLYSLE